MKHILPVFFPPISNCYSACSGVASILQAYDRHNPALFLDRLYLFRKNNNVIKFAKIENTNEVDKIKCGEKNICELLMTNLDNDDYVFLPLDHFFLKCSSHYHTYPFVHDVALIYGYDLDKRIFYCADNFFNGKYSSAEISFTEIEQAWCGIPNHREVNIVIFHYNHLIKGNHLDLYKVNLVLHDYINSKIDNIINLNPTFMFDNILGFHNKKNSTFESCIFGIKIYDWMLQDIKETNKMDVRPLHLLMNHQAIFLCLIECIYSDNKVVQLHKYAEILDKQKNDCEIVRNLAIKYNLSKNEEIRKRIIRIVEKVYAQERVFLETFLSDKLIWK